MYLLLLQQSKSINYISHRSYDGDEIALRTLEVETPVNGDLALVRQVDGKVTEAVCHVDPVSAHTVIRAKPHAVTWHNEVFHQSIHTCIYILRMDTLEDGSSYRRQLQTKRTNC
jgi:hypothetical protein